MEPPCGLAFFSADTQPNIYVCFKHNRLQGSSFALPAYSKHGGDASSSSSRMDQHSKQTRKFVEQTQAMGIRLLEPAHSLHSTLRVKARTFSTAKCEVAMAMGMADTPKVKVQG